jgi:hypothetical protein
MALSLKNIQKARDAGFNDDQIVNIISKNDPEFGQRISKAKAEGFDSKTIMSIIEKKLSSTEQQQQPPQEPKAIQQPEEPPKFTQPSQVITNPQGIKQPWTMGQTGEHPQFMMLPEQQAPETPAEKVVEVSESMDGKKPKNPFDDRELTREEVVKLTPDELKQYSESLKKRATLVGGFKGFLSGRTLGLSEYLPALKPEEDQSGVMLGEFMGAALPINAIANYVGMPLLKLIGASSLYKHGLESFVRIANMAVTGSIYEGIRKGVKTGEMPTAEELATHARDWAAFESILVGLGKWGQLALAIKNSGGGKVMDKINQVISKVNLSENNPETLSKQIDSAITEVFADTKGLSKEAVAEIKSGAQKVVDALPEGNKKKILQKAIDRKQVRNEQQAQKMSAEYDAKFPLIQGKTTSDRNRKFLNKYSEQNPRVKRDIEVGPKEELPEAFSGTSMKLRNEKEVVENTLKEAVTDLRAAKKSGDKAAQIKAQKSINRQKKKLEDIKQREQLEALEQKVEVDPVEKLQKKVDVIQSRIDAAKAKGKNTDVLQKNLTIQQSRLQAAKQVHQNSVPNTPQQVNTTQPTLQATTPQNVTNPNVVQAIANNPVQTLSQGAYTQPGFQTITNAIKGTKRSLRSGVKWVMAKNGQQVLRADPDSSIYKKGWRMVEDWLGEREGLKERFMTKWNDTIGKNKNISKQDREDMIFYRERTGNPFIPGDTFQALESRISKEAKDVVDTVVDKHMKEALKMMNDAPFIKAKVNPRKSVEDIYIRHFYSGKVSRQKINEIFDSQLKKFGTDNPFKNMRTFLTFEEALQKAGLVPKYRDIVQNIAAQDGILARVMSNNKLVESLHDLETQMSQRMVVRDVNKKMYQQAKNDGWVPFQDPWMRSYVAGTDKSGKKMWAVTEAPALVHPDLASSLAGPFSKDAYKPENAFLRMYDGINSMMNKIHVGASLFHFNALGESFTSAGGFVSSIVTSPKWWKQGSKILMDSPFIEDAVRHGLKINRPTDLDLEKANTYYQKMMTTLQANKNPLVRQLGNVGEAANGMARIHKFLFGEFQPRMKVITYENYVNRIMNYYQKKGMHPNAELTRDIKRQAASAVNDQFGGQYFELIPFLNDKQKGIHRIFSFPDWTVSAVREVSQAMASDSPIRRKLGQRYLVEYLMGLTFGTQMLSYAFTGLTNKPDGSITWDPEKAHSTFENEDPKRRNMFDVQMPDIYITVGGDKINVSRDEQGRLYHMHGGKKVREIYHYFEDPVTALFSKSTALVQQAVKWALGYTPAQDGLFPVRGAYTEGEFRPWDGSKKWTTDRAVSMAKDMASTMLPYSLQTVISDTFDSKEEWYKALIRTGAKFVMSGAGGLAVGKGISLRSSEQYFEKAYQIENEKQRSESLRALRTLLKGYGYSDKQINTVQTKIKNRVSGKIERR